MNTTNEAKWVSFLALTPAFKCESVLGGMVNPMGRKELEALSQARKDEAARLLLECERSQGRAMKNKEYLARLVTFFENVQRETPNEMMRTGAGAYALQSARELLNNA